MDPDTDRTPSEHRFPKQTHEVRHMGREHQGATEDEMTPTPPPATPEYDDEPRQG